MFLDSMSDRRSYRKGYQNRKQMIIYAVDSSDDWFNIRSHISNSEIYDLLIENSNKLKKYAKAIFEFDQQGELTNSIKGIVTSIIHMFCNRLIGGHLKTPIDKSSSFAQKVIHRQDENCE